MGTEPELSKNRLFHDFYKKKRRFVLVPFALIATIFIAFRLLPKTLTVP